MVTEGMAGVKGMVEWSGLTSGLLPQLPTVVQPVPLAVCSHWEFRKHICLSGHCAKRDVE